MSDARNVLGSGLQVCSVSPMTGFARDGACHTGPQDIGSHTVCVQMTEAFLSIRKVAATISAPLFLNWVSPD